MNRLPIQFEILDISQPIGLHGDSFFCFFTFNPVHSWEDAFEGGSARREAAIYTQDILTQVKCTETLIPRVKFELTLPQHSSRRIQFLRETARPLWPAVLRFS